MTYVVSKQMHSVEAKIKVLAKCFQIEIILELIAINFSNNYNTKLLQRLLIEVLDLY